MGSRYLTMKLLTMMMLCSWYMFGPMHTMVVVDAGCAISFPRLKALAAQITRNACALTACVVTQQQLLHCLRLSIRICVILSVRLSGNDCSAFSYRNSSAFCPSRSCFVMERNEDVHNTSDAAHCRPKSFQ